MEQKFKIIPFCLEKAKTPENSNGLDVVTRDGHDVKIIYSDYKGEYNKPIIGLVQNYRKSQHERCFVFYEDGHFNPVGIDDDDLFLKEPIKAHRMTNQELAWWLKEHPEEHRELKYATSSMIYTEHIYNEDSANEEVCINNRIRSNGGKWREPLIEIEEEN